MAQPKILILSGYGLNCEEETALAFSLAGGEAQIIHINDLISEKQKLMKYQILAVPGGLAMAMTRAAEKLMPISSKTI